MRIGYKLATEAFGPAELIDQAVRAEQVGFDFVEISDHFHPWLDSQGHSPFTWSVLGAIAARTERIGLVTGVTCPSLRYHPAIIAQAAATMALLSDGRFTLGVGAGERLNEHVTGQPFPSVQGRHERLREALEIIRLLWSGGYHSYQGKHLQLDDARVFDQPVRPTGVPPQDLVAQRRQVLLDRALVEQEEDVDPAQRVDRLHGELIGVTGTDPDDQNLSHLVSVP